MKHILRHVGSLLLTLAVLGGAAFLVYAPGSVSIEWLGHHMQFPVAMLVIFTVLLIVLTRTALRLFDAVCAWPRTMRDFFEGRRQQQAEKMLFKGLSALAAHQVEEAQSCVVFAQKFLPKHPLTSLVAARLAELTRDSEQARMSFMEMTQNESTAFLGTRGLIEQAQKENNWHSAHKLLLTAFEARPDSPWIIQELLHNSLLLAESEVWTPAMVQSMKDVYRNLDKKTIQRHEALLLWLQAQHVAHENQAYENLVRQAHERAPSIPEITRALAQIEQKKSGDKAARKVLKRGFEAMPHRSLYATWKQTRAKIEPVGFYRALEADLMPHVHHVETQWMLMQAAIEAQLWGQAEQHGHALLADGDDRDVCLLWAHMCRALGPANEAQAHMWQTRALHAAHVYTWSCQTCSVHLGSWSVVCPSCQSTDTIHWACQPLKATAVKRFSQGAAPADTSQPYLLTSQS